MDEAALETLRAYVKDKHPASECPMTCGEVYTLLEGYDRYQMARTMGLRPDTSSVVPIRPDKFDAMIDSTIAMKNRNFHNG